MPKKRVFRGGEIQNGGKVRGGKSICRRLSHARVSYYFFRPKLDEIHFATLFSPESEKKTTRETASKTKKIAVEAS